jgi:hypothetical protein
MKKQIVLIAFSMALFGCADTHQLMRPSSATVLLPGQASACVAIPRDGRYGQTSYPGSGALTAQAVAAAFAPYLTKTTVALSFEELEAAQRSAKAGGYSHVIYPQILHWEDRATEWSMKPDVASVKISLIALDRGVVLDSAVVGGKSGVATLGGDRPEHLLPKPLADYAASLFGPQISGGTVPSYAVPAAHVTPSAPSQPATPASTPTRNPAMHSQDAPPRQIGTFAVGAEKVARAEKCSTAPVAMLTAKGPGFESFSVNCTDGKVLVIECDFGSCRAMR